MQASPRIGRHFTQLTAPVRFSIATKEAAMHYFVKALQEHRELAVFLVVALGFLVGR